MSLFSFLTDLFSSTSIASHSDSTSTGSLFSGSEPTGLGSRSMVINPATGLPMVGDSTGGVDVGGSPYGQSWSTYDTFGSFDSCSSYDSFSSMDSFSSLGSGSSFDSCGGFGSGMGDW